MSPQLRFAFLPVLCLSATAFSQDSDLQSKLQAIEKAVEQKRIETNTPGLGLAIVKDGKVVYTGGFGFRDVEKKLAVTADTQFAIGSATKAFVAMLTAMSADAGNVKFADHPRKWIPDFHLYDKEADEKMTVGDLLSHRIGLPRTDVIWYTGVLDTEDLLWAVSKIEPTAKYGAKFQYQNVMFAAVGEALENAEGKDWEALAKEKILGPLRMDNSNLTVQEMLEAPDFAKGYAYVGGQEQFRNMPQRSIPSVGAAGAINSSARDMAKWVQLMLAEGKFDGNQLVSKEQFDELLKPRTPISPTMAYGYGWFLQDWKGKKVVQHGGNIDGFSALVGFMPEANVGFVALTNGNVSTLPYAVMETVWTHLVGSSEAEQNGVPVVEPQREVGTYRLAPANMDMVVTLESGKLRIQPSGQPKLDLIHLGDRRFKVAPPAPDGLFVTFRDSKEEPGTVEAEFEQGGQKFVMKQPASYKADIAPEELMAKVVEAAGGEEAFNEIKTVRATYRAEMVNQGVTATGIRLNRAPNQFADISVMRAAGRQIGTVHSFYNGEVAVDDASFSAPDVKAGADLGDAILGGYLMPELAWSDFASVVITGLEKVGEHEAYVVELTPRLGNKVRSWISNKSFRVLKRETGTGPAKGTDVLEEYKEVAGVWIPFRVVRDSALFGRTVTTIESLQVNVPLPESLFKLLPR